MVSRFKYKAIKANGQPVRGVLTAANQNDLYSQLQMANMELVSCSEIKEKKSLNIDLLKKVKVRELIQFFVNLKQMQGAGIGILEAIADLRDTADNNVFKDILSEMYKDITEGSSLSEAMARHPKVFKTIHVSLMSAGEENGDIEASCDQLVIYLKWLDAMQTRVRKATRYPIILLVVVVATVAVMMGKVVPQIVGFLENMDQDLPFLTTSLIATSEFFVNYFWYILLTPVALYVGVRIFMKYSEKFSYQIDSLMLRMPVMGVVIRKISIARFAQTFSALFAGGIEIIKALRAASQTANNMVLKDALNDVEIFVKQGDPISVALNKSGQFPSMVVRMVKVGEESGNLSEVLDQVAEFYTNDVDEEVQKVITMIEPSLTAVLGVMILWIAAGVFGPIYSTIGNVTGF
ncbi:MAG: type II secretion system F family protein [Pseudomonadota bacterium]